MFIVSSSYLIDVNNLNKIYFYCEVLLKTLNITDKVEEILNVIIHIFLFYLIIFI